MCLCLGLAELFIVAVGLSMDAFAVAICKGLSLPRLKLKHALLVGLYFGLFQGLMPAAGYLLGSAFSSMVVQIDHWIAFILLGIIGINMIRESLHAENGNCDPSLSFRAMLPLAVATSIDALTVGISFAFLNVPIIPAVSFIAVITFTLSTFGVWLGHVFGSKFKSKAEFLGGVVLILMGTKILLEHLGFINF